MVSTEDQKGASMFQTPQGFQNPLFQTPTFGGFKTQLDESPDWPRAGPLALSLVSPIQPNSSDRFLNLKSDETQESKSQEEFAEILKAALQEEIEPRDVLNAQISSLDSRTKDLRRRALKQQNRFRTSHESEAANDLSQESAIWKLLFTLYANPDSEFPGGYGGPSLKFCGVSLLYQQKIAKILREDEQLNKIARVVAWLEKLASDSLNFDEEDIQILQGTRTEFSERQGLPSDTKEELSSRGLDNANSPVYELDPDACTRQGKTWVETDRIESARITEFLWKLVRAGKIQEAQEVCRKCGQSWRAVTIGGPFGPRNIPLGENAELDQELAGEQAQECYANEVNIGSNTLSEIWRASCTQAAEQLSPENKHEAAIYGILGGSIQHVLPICTEWHDKLWAYCRVWLESEIHEILASNDGYNRDGVSMQESLGGFSVNSRSGPCSWGELEERLALPLTSNPSLSLYEQYCVIQWNLIQGFEKDDFFSLLCDILPSLLLSQEELEDDGISLARRNNALKILRISTHICIALMDFQLIPETHFPDLAQELIVIQESVTNLISSYLGHLLDERKYDLVPQYTCRVPSQSRRQICCEMLANLTREDDSETQMNIFNSLSACFSDWYQQERGDIEDDELAQIAEMVAGTSRWVPTDGPKLKAQSAAWLWKGPFTFLLSLQHSNALLREFSLGNEEAMLAAQTLLENVPDEVQRLINTNWQVIEEGSWGESLMDAGFASEDALPAIQEELLQLFAWSSYFKLCMQFRSWKASQAESLGSPGSEILKSEGFNLLQDHISILSQAENGDGPILRFLCTELQSNEEPHLVCLLSKEQDLGEYEGWTEEEGQNLIAKVQNYLREIQANSEPNTDLQIEIELMNYGLEGKPISVSLRSQSAKSLEKGVHILSLLLKGCLEEKLQPVCVINIQGTEEVVTELCKATCYARCVLQASFLRLALVELGEDKKIGEELVPLIAGNGENYNYEGLTPYMAPLQIQEFLENERRTIITSELNSYRRRQEDLQD